MENARPPPPVIGARLVVCLGLAQLVAWGTMHYLISIFGGPIARELQLGGAWVQAGFSLALLVMGAASGWIGRWIGEHGGRRAMMAGCWLGAAGCALLATSHAAPQFYASWVLLGLGMRLALYDAAFAALAHLGGQSAKRAMSQITIIGGLASTVFWPIGEALLQRFGWRGALLGYALLLLASSALHLAIPRSAPPAAAAPGTARDSAGRSTAAAVGAAAAGGAGDAERWLYGVIAAIAMFMQTGIAAHFIELLIGLGWRMTTAVAIATSLGLGQFCARGWIALQAHRFDAVRLNLLPGALLCAGFALSLAFGSTLAGAVLFAFCYGAGNGTATITRGSMPLLLFDPAGYGRIVGAILRPAFMLAACAPVALALAIERFGARGMLAIALGLSLLLLAASVALLRRHEARRIALLPVRVP